MKTQFMHIMTQDCGGVTLALRRVELGGDVVRYEVGAAFASPSEQQFDRKRGRLIAEGRMNAKRHGYLHFLRDEKNKKESITKNGMLNYLRRLHTKSRRDQSQHGPDWYGGFLRKVGAR